MVCGHGLRIEDLVRVARYRARTELSSDPSVRTRIRQSQEAVQHAIEAGRPIYGVTTGFGGMAHVEISSPETAELQSNLLWFLRAGAGEQLPIRDVRSGMLLRANSLMHGVSGLRLELIERLILFLNHHVTPHVRNLGSIGASGDLIPLASVASAVIGLSDDCLVDFDGQTIGAITALGRLGLQPLGLLPKEGLALVNGTSMLTGIAAGCLYDSKRLLGIALTVHAMMLQALGASNQPFQRFIHEHKPHPGQMFIAVRMLELLSGSQLIREELEGVKPKDQGRLIQDRYSIRCLPQFLGPILDGIAGVTQQVEVEMNSATDNPLFDPESQVSYHGGNYLGQYVAIGMDQLRFHLGLLAKHLDVQISLLMEPTFSGGLPGSLVGNSERPVNMGLKGLQLAGNSIMPLIGFFGNSLVDRFPTHAEQFNQNINSQGFGSANLARRSVELLEQYLAIALIFAIQAVELQTRKVAGRCDARESLSAGTIDLYETIYSIIDRRIDRYKPLIFNDHEQAIEKYLDLLVGDLRDQGRLFSCIEPLVAQIDGYDPRSYLGRGTNQ